MKQEDNHDDGAFLYYFFKKGQVLFEMTKEKFTVVNGRLVVS